MLASSSSCTQRTRRPRGPLAAVTLAVVPLFAAGCMATAAPSTSEPVERERQEYSADGVVWGGTSLIPWDTTTVPAPGGDPNATSFHLRVDGDSRVEGEVYLGNWSIDRGSSWFRVDVNGVPGETVTLSSGGDGGPGVLMSDFPIPAGDAVLLTLNVGVPFSETLQTARVAPDWAITLRETGSGGGSGSGSSGSSGGSGSLGSLGNGSSGSSGSSAGSSASSGSSTGSGSAGSSAGSTGSISAGSLGAPLVGGW